MSTKRFTRAILELRTEHNLSQKQLGEKLGFSPNTICDWEKGKTEPSIDTINKIVAMFDISYEELLKD